MFFLIIGLIFSPLVAGATFLITYEEYSQHRTMDRKRVFRIALDTALYILVAFVVVIVLFGFILSKTIR